LIVVSGSNGQGLLVEIPDLSLSTVWSLDDHVSVVDQVEVSLAWQGSYDVEVSLNVKTELLVQLSLSWFVWVFISIDNLPSLVNLSVSLVNNDVSVLSINTALNIKDFTFLIDDEFTIFLEKLPPSRANT